MKHHEREFFIAQIRTGKSHIKDKGLIIVPAPLDLVAESCVIYNEAYNQAFVDGLMDQEENEQWLEEQGLWTYEEEQKLKNLQKDIERLKTEAYNARHNSRLLLQIKAYIRAGEKQLAQHLDIKNRYYGNTCEGIAATEKASFLIKNTTFTIKGEPYDFAECSLSYVIDEWQKTLVSESDCRELARTEPWKSLWIIREKAQIKIFANEDNTDLTYNQKNLIIWSQMYDNVQESMDCPTKEVIEDDDMLDGWFILQSKKREKEKAEQDFEASTKSDKIKNAGEVFVMSSSDKDKERVDSLNSTHTSVIKKQREALLRNAGSVEQHQFMDEKLRVATMQTNQYKEHFKR